MKVLYICLVIFIFSLTSYPAYGARTVHIKEGDTWHYFKGPGGPPDKWQHTGFDDSGWEQGPSGFGYGKGKNNTLLNDMKGKYKTVYVRREFTIMNYSRINRVTLSLVCDGPFIAYLDGIEVLRSRKRQRGDILDLSGFAHELDHSRNVVAIQCSNDDINSDDFSFIPVFYLNEE